jgi:steroid delta-isomerase-like uncharacterized protein
MGHADTMRKMYDQVSTGDLDGFGARLADDLVEHEVEPGMEPTKAGVLAFFETLRAAFPDLKMELQDAVVDGDKAVARVRATGTHQGEFEGIPATGKSIDVLCFDMFRFDGAGLVSEHWGLTDTMAMMQQMGVVPDGS